MIIRRVIKYFGWALAVLVAWTGVIAGLTFFSEPGSSVAIFTAPGRAADTAVRAGGSLEDFSSMIAITRSRQPDFVARLYGAGAFLVVDARVVSGCRAAFTKSKRLLGQ